MSKFAVNQKLWNIFPDTEIAVLIAKDIDNTDYKNVPENLLENANENSKKWVELDPISENSVIKDWRNAYQKFKTKRGARCAVENLLKRAKNGKGVGKINPVVDIYNSVSLNWAFPIAGEDINKIQGDIELTVASGGEKFLPIGEHEVEEALSGEVIYKDEQSIISRCWAWRDSARVEVNEESKNLIFYMENINPNRKADHEEAIKELQKKLLEYLGIKTDVTIISKDNSEVEY